MISTDRERRRNSQRRGGILAERGEITEIKELVERRISIATFHPTKCLFISDVVSFIAMTSATMQGPLKQTVAK